jgi:probable phosphoglycerate mutase
MNRADVLTRRIVVLAFLAVTLASAHRADAQTLVYVVRHAERADGGNQSPAAELDPPLSAEGRLRARKLAALLADANIAAIYVTELKRTQETAGPLATLRKLTPIVVPSRDPARLVSSIRRGHATDIVLVIVHSSTMSGVVRAFGGPLTTIADDDYGTIVVLVPGTGVVSRLHY